MRAAIRESDGGGAPPHVVMVPVPKQGHINPFYCLAHCLAASGISVTLVHSAASARTHSGVVPPSSSIPIHIEVLPDTDLPSNFKAALSTSTHNFNASLSALRAGVEQLLERLMQEKQVPCCLLVDSLLGWGREVAIKFGLPRVEVWPSSISVFAMGYHLPELVARGYIPAIEQGSLEKTVDFIPGLSSFTIADLPEGIAVQEGLQSPAFQFFSSVFENAKDADCMLANTIYELESSALDALSTQCGVHVYPIGPLFMMSASFSSAPSSDAASLLQEDNSCLPWLHQRQECSVLYISFGSVAAIGEDVFTELAHGVEASGESFLWVIRADAFTGKASVEELLPQGFMERTSDRGLVISWAPQLAVLAHPSVGAFLTHCGWNSVLESLSNGVPILGFPQLAEQNTNLKFIVHDWKVGLPLLQPSHAGKVHRSHVQSAVIAIMRGDQGTQVRKRALQLREIAHNATHGTSKSNLQKFVDDLKHGHLKPSNSGHASQF